MKKYQVFVTHYRTKKRVPFVPDKKHTSKKTGKNYIDFVKRTTTQNNLKYFKNPRLREVSK